MKSKKSPELPEIKSVGQLTTEATQANIANLPAIMEAYKKYGPEAASSMLAAAQALNPTLKPLGDLLNKRIEEVSAGGIPATLRGAYENEFRNSMASRGFVDSPASANAEAIGLAGLGEEYAQNTITGANNYQRGLGETPGLAELGLDLPTIQSNVGIGQEQNISDINMALDQASRKKSQTNRLGSIIGGGIGGIAGGFVDAPLAGAQAGASIGGTFF